MAKQAQAFDAEIELSLNGKKANAKSILSVMILCAEHGAEVRLSASGNDAEEAVRAITALFASNFEEPLRPDVSEKMTESPRSAQLSGGVGEMVLVADDEQCIRELVGKVLERNGYRPLLARNGLEAVSLYTANASNIKVAVFDMIMPEMNGFEAISAIRRMNPNLPVLSMSGSMEKPPLPIDATTAFLQKPFTLAEFLPALRTLLDGAPSARAVGAHSR